MATYGTPEVLLDIPEVTFVGTKRHSSSECVEENELLNGNGGRTSIKDRAAKTGYGSERDESGKRGLIEYFRNSSYAACKERDDSHQMQDAPFGDNSRSGSEEDMLDYDDDDESLFSCDLCRRRRPPTNTEKGLIGFGLLCLVVIIILAVRLGHKEETKVYKTCESEECLRTASSILSAMDATADPCRDFHQYACGGWLEETPIPPGYPVWDRFQELSHKNMYMLKNLIESHKLYGTAQQKVRTFYRSCMAESQVPRQTTLEDFRRALEVVAPDGGDFDIRSALSEAHRMGTWPLFQLMVGPDEREPDNNIIKIEAGISSFPHGIFKTNETKSIHERSPGAQPNSTTSSMNKPGTATPDIVNLAGTDSNTDTDQQGYTHQNNTTDRIGIGKNSTAEPGTAAPGIVNLAGTDSNTDTDQQGYKLQNNDSDTTTTTTKPTTTTMSTPTTTQIPNIKDTHPHPTENISELVQAYLEETTVLIQSLRQKSRQEAEKEAQLILQLEKRLSLAHDLGLHIHNRTMAYNTMSISTLQNKCNMVDWTAYLQGVMKGSAHTVTKKEKVVVLHETALLKVCNIVHEYSANDTTKGILRSYIQLSVARSLKPYFDMSTFDPTLDVDEELDAEGEHWRRCTFYANRALGYATGSIYVSGTAAEQSIAQVKTLVEHVKTAFKDYLLRKIWLDPKTKHNAAAKIDEMIEKVSYPSYILNITFLDDYYKQFVIGQDWFRNILNWREFAIRKMVSALDEKYDRLHSWINPPVTVEADYSPVRNDIIFPIALFHLPIFSLDGPSAMNFGAMGSLIGHEITHAFDIQGRQYDGFGRLRDWWDPITASMFNETTFCMKDQYDHFKVGNLTINGAQTLEENIADNGGLRAAHVAFQLWIREHGEDAPLPGVSLNNQQLFYITFAQLHCSKWKEEGIRDFLLRDSHSPGPFRIEGALQNSQAFQDVFQCSYTSRYNPSTKCQVW